jgi:hypothetical protein
MRQSQLILSHRIGCEWNQGQVTRALDSTSQAALVSGACACLPTGADLPTLGQITAQHIGIPIGNLPHFIQAKVADFTTTRAKSRGAAATRPIRPALSTSRFLYFFNFWIEIAHWLNSLWQLYR